MCQGDKEAFETIFLAYYEDLCSFASQYVASGIAEDLVQGVFLSLWRRRENIGPQINPRAYLYKAVRNEALKHKTCAFPLA